MSLIRGVFEGAGIQTAIPNKISCRTNSMDIHVLNVGCK